MESSMLRMSIGIRPLLGVVTLLATALAAALASHDRAHAAGGGLAPPKPAARIAKERIATTGTSDALDLGAFSRDNPSGMAQPGVGKQP
jgi:hypothetical protein